MSYQDLINSTITIAREASKVIMNFYEGDIASKTKSDGSPVTAADQAADNIIFSALNDLTPNIPIISEERVDNGIIPDVSGGTFWLVDPLDGTKEFINRNGDFTVNIGLIESEIPKLGVIMTPVNGLVWAGINGMGAFEENPSGLRHSIMARRADKRALTVVASRSHRSDQLEDYISNLKVKNSISRGSALKFCLVAKGDADLYPRTGPTMEWDTAAGHALLLAAGGTVETFDGKPFLYAKEDFLNGWFIARGK